MDEKSGKHPQKIIQEVEDFKDPRLLDPTNFEKRRHYNSLEHAKQKYYEKMISCKKNVDMNKMEFIMENIDSFMQMSTLKK